MFLFSLFVITLDYPITRTSQYKTSKKRLIERPKDLKDSELYHEGRPLEVVESWPMTNRHCQCESPIHKNLTIHSKLSTFSMKSSISRTIYVSVILIILSHLSETSSYLNTIISRIEISHLQVLLMEIHETIDQGF